MRTRQTLLALAAIAAALLAGACENDLTIRDPQRFAPPNASVVTSNGSITVHWTSDDDAGGYTVFVSESSETAGAIASCDGEGGEGEQVSPCTILGQEPGQLYYVRVKSHAADGTTDHDPDDEDLPALAVRAGFQNIPRTPFTWAGTGVFVEDSETVALKGMWFDDVAQGVSEYTCYTYWDSGDEAELSPCTNADLSLENGGATALARECRSPVCYPIFEVEAGDGRRGQSYTRVVHP